MLTESYPALKSNKVYVLIVNWNGWADTIECLETVFKSDFSRFCVVVCDNGSRNASLDRIKSWADGNLNVRVPLNNPLRRLSFPPLPKPIGWVEYSRAEAEVGGRYVREEAALVLIQTGENLGFAGGNNVGLRYILARGDFAFVWLLNNDTVVEPDALRTMVDKMVNTPGAGICGSTIPYYADPIRIWALGGATYNRWLGITRCVGLRQRLTPAMLRDKHPKRLAYVAGASMLVSCAFLRRIGLLCEDYFLYFEELDWATRAEGQFILTYAPDSIVYHKVGVSTSAANALSADRKDTYSDRRMSQSALLFTRKHFKVAIPTVWGAALLVRVIKRTMRLVARCRFDRRIADQRGTA